MTKERETHLMEKKNYSMYLYCLHRQTSVDYPPMNVTHSKQLGHKVS